jgi:hypothetical protein
MSPWLTLDESTLFYWTLSNAAPCENLKRKHFSAINEWASEIATNHPKSKLNSSNHAKSTPSLTNGTSRSSAPSVLSDQVKIIIHQPNKVKVEPVYHRDEYNGGLSDNDKVKGEEREVAINSPPKGKKRITSEVFFSYLFNPTI